MLDGKARHKPEDIPEDLRERLETARLDLLALFRALDRMYLNPNQILFVEPVGSGSKVAQLIADSR